MVQVVATQTPGIGQHSHRQSLKIRSLCNSVRACVGARVCACICIYIRLKKQRHQGAGLEAVLAVAAAAMGADGCPCASLASAAMTAMTAPGRQGRPDGSRPDGMASAAGTAAAHQEQPSTGSSRRCLVGVAGHGRILVSIWHPIQLQQQLTSLTWHPLSDAPIARLATHSRLPPLAARKAQADAGGAGDRLFLQLLRGCAPGKR